MTKTLSATFAWLSKWDRQRWIYLAASVLIVLVGKFTGSPWFLNVLSDVALGGAAFCWGAGYVQSKRECEARA